MAWVDNQDIIRLEERIAHLERHIEEQDREIYRQGELVKRLVREVETNRQRLRDMADAKDIPPGDERPPHY